MGVPTAVGALKEVYAGCMLGQCAMQWQMAAAVLLLPAQPRVASCATTAGS
jgi:hypothetical protein